MEIQLSIALVTRNRPVSLEKTLESLSKQSIQPFEIVISDDSNTEEFINLIKAIAAKYNCKYIQGPQKGLYANRNFVAKHCSGTHIRTMDDDHEFPKDHLKICLDAIEKDDSAIWTIGEYMPWDEDRPLPAPIPGQLHPRGYSYTPNDMTKYYGISCGATIYPKFVIDNNELNNECFKFGIIYLEYGVRLYKKKYVIRHLEDTYVIHHFQDNVTSETSLEIINSAKIFSMLMLSFHYYRSFKNISLTTGEIIKGIISKKFPLKLVLNSYKLYKQETKK